MGVLINHCAWLRALEKGADASAPIRKQICELLFRGESLWVTPGILEELQKRRSMLPPDSSESLDRILPYLAMVLRGTEQPPLPGRWGADRWLHDQIIADLNLLFPLGSRELWNTSDPDLPELIEQVLTPAIRSMPSWNQAADELSKEDAFWEKVKKLEEEVQRLHALCLKQATESLTPSEQKEKLRLEKSGSDRANQLASLKGKVTVRIWTDLESALHALHQGGYRIVAEDDLLGHPEILPLWFKRERSSDDVEFDEF
jgi:hypothetical protein